MENQKSPNMSNMMSGITDYVIRTKDRESNPYECFREQSKHSKISTHTKQTIILLSIKFFKIKITTLKFPGLEAEKSLWSYAANVMCDKFIWI